MGQDNKRMYRELIENTRRDMREMDEKLSTLKYHYALAEPDCLSKGEGYQAMMSITHMRNTVAKAEEHLMAAERALNRLPNTCTGTKEGDTE